VSRIARIGFILFFFAIAGKVAAVPAISVLFVGNSLTQVNNLPEVFKKFAAESTLHADVDVKSITPGGAMLYDHWKRGEALVLLREQHPNYLILQGQSTEPLSAPQNFACYAARLKAEADRVHAKTILFSTLARPAGDLYYKDQTSGGTPTEMQRRLNSAYSSLAKNIGATLAPVGVAWQHAHRAIPDIQLLDGTQHPSPSGTYLAAAALFRTVFNTPATGSTFYDGLLKETALRLQHVADEGSLSPE
jgi:hypothetical protein